MYVEKSDLKGLIAANSRTRTASSLHASPQLKSMNHHNYLQSTNKPSRVTWLSVIGALLVATAHSLAAEPSLPKISVSSPSNISLRNEVKHAIDKGWAWLEKSQNTNGFWSTPDHPAITALALTAYRLQPDVLDQKHEAP